MALADQLRICSDALVMVGDAPITTFDSEDARAVVAARRYPVVVREHLAWTWGFNRRQQRLARIDGPMPEGSAFSGRYAMPPDMLLKIGPVVNGQVDRDWEIIEGEVHLAAGVDDVVALRYHGITDESSWSPRFVSAIEMFLAASFALSLRENEDVWSIWHKQAEIKIREARQADRSEEPGEAIAMDRLQSMRRR